MPDHPEGTLPDGDDLQELIAGALAAHDQGGETELAEFLARLGPRAAQVQSIVSRFLAAGMLQSTRGAPSFPERLGEFRLLRRLGAGGMGMVFVAEQASLRREVALKVVHPELMLFEGARERFRREVDAVARLRHPAIVPIVAVGEDRGVPYFAMELVEGRSGEQVTEAMQGRQASSLRGDDLWQVLRPVASDGATSAPVIFDGLWWQVIARLCAQVARAMRHAHLRGIVHRDLKPSNVMLTPHGQAMVLDFGLAHIEASERITRTSSELGSPAYMSPEQVRNEPLDERTDVYSLGATLYQLLCLVPPFHGRDAHELRARILLGAMGAPRTRNRALPRDLEIVCCKALDVDRERRYASMADFAADLEAVAEGRPVIARPLGRSRRLLRWAHRHRPLAAALAVAGSFLVLLPAAMWWQQQRANRRLQTEFSRAQRNLEISKDAISAMLVQVGTIDLGSTPGAETLRVKLIEDAVALYERLLADQSDDPVLQRERGRTLQQLGKMLVELGRFDEAEKVVGESIALLAGESHALAPAAILARADARQTLAALHMQRGEFAAARQALESKRQDLEVLLRHDPRSDEARAGLMTALAMLAECAEKLDPDTKETAAAREGLLRQALHLTDELLASRPGDPQLSRSRASKLHDLALVLEEQDRCPDALATLDAEIALVEPLADDKNARPRKAELLMLAWSAKGSTYFSLEDYASSAQAHAMSVTFAEQLVRDFPQIVPYTSRLGTMLFNLGAAHARPADHAAAEPVFRRAIALQREAIARNPKYAEAQRNLVQFLIIFGHTLRALGKRAELVAAADEIARTSARPRHKVEAAGMLADALVVSVSPQEPAAFDPAATAQRAMALLLEVEKAGWPADAIWNADRFAVLAHLPEFTAFAERRGR